MKSVIPILLVVLVAHGPVVAGGARDEEEGGSRLDIETVTGERLRRDGRWWWRFRMETYERFNKGDLTTQGSDEHYKAISFHFEHSPGGGFERVVFIEAREHDDGSYRVFARVTKGRTDTGGRWGAGTVDVAKAYVSRRGPSAIQVRLWESALGLRNDRFRWAARTASEKSPTGSQITFDYAPEDRLIRERW